MTSRSRAMLKVILDSSHSLKIKDIARDFQVSERTIKYDLENIRLWLKERNVTLHSQPNKGIWIDEEKESLQELREDLQGHGSNDLFLHQKERSKHLAIMLLLAEGYQRLNDLSTSMGVSRNTVITDVKEAEKLLEGWHLELITKQRYGIRVDGSERQKRFALECLLHDMLDSADMYRMVQGMLPEHGSDASSGPLLKRWLVSPVELCEITRAIKGMVHHLDASLTDRTLISFLIRLCMVVHRVKRGLIISEDEADTAEAALWSGYSFFLQEVRQLCERVEVTMPEHEIAYACLPLLGTKRLQNESGTGRPELDIYQAARELTKAVGTTMQAPLADDPELSEHLFAHLNDRMTRYRQGVLYPNPLTDEIRRSYARMFDAVKRACEKVFWQHGVYLLDADIAYLVLHFQAGYDRWMEQKKAHALVVCGTGRGTSRFLKTHLESELRSLRIVGLCSSTEVEKYLSSRKVDVIISVLPVKADVPVVIVNPLPTRQDIIQIQTCLEALQLEGEERHGSRKKESTWLPDLTADLNTRDFPLVERLSQDVICKGYEISQNIIQSFRGHLTEQAASGLTLHVLLMVNRLAFGSPYEEWDTGNGEDATGYADWRARLNHLMEEAQIRVPQSEVTAILRYFSGKRAHESESGSADTGRVGNGSLPKRE